jgi:hypothetical protein
MQLWDENASAWTVEDYLRRYTRRMRVHQRINDDLTETQRTLLGSEATLYDEPINTLRTGARTLEDFGDLTVLEHREAVVVRDQLVDTAQDEAWKIIGLRKSVLATVGQTRERVFETTKITMIKEASREVTVERAATISSRIATLPSFEERDRLATRLRTHGEGMKEEQQGLEASEQQESELRAELRRLSAVQRVAVVGSYGRLLGAFPKGFVESLFPSPRSKPVKSTPPSPPSPPSTPE